MDRTGPIALLSAETLLAEARGAQNVGQLNRAIHVLETLLGQFPKHAQALNMLGLALLRHGDPLRARDILSQATAADPGAPSLWLNLAQAQRQLKDSDGERQSLTAAIDRDPYLLIAHVRKAELHSSLKEEAYALQAWQAVLTICDNDPQPSEAIRHLIQRANAYIEPRVAQMAAEMQRGLEKARAKVETAATRRFDAAVDHAMGKRPIYLSQSSGLHFPFLPADEFFPRESFPWIGALEAATNDIRREFEAALNTDGEGFAPYVDQPTGAATNVWSELSRSTRWSAYYLWRYGIRSDNACLQCPMTAKALEALPRADQPNRAPTAFFSLLAPGTRIPPHTGVSNTRAIVHLPLVVPPECGFRVGGETRQWRVGEAFAFDDTIEHEAWNDSDEYRAVLIFDVWNPYLSSTERELLKEFYLSADLSGLTPEHASAFTDLKK